jgi:hypothetical protein
MEKLYSWRFMRDLEDEYARIVMNLILAMESCGQADNQQWYVERLSDVPRLTRLTNRETGATRCLEAVQTGFKMTPCSRHQGGHRWHSNYEPTL